MSEIHKILMIDLEKLLIELRLKAIIIFAILAEDKTNGRFLVLNLY